MAALLVAACATLTPEEKAAREAAIKESVKTAVASQKYKINVNSVKPMRGIDRTVSGPFLKVDSNTVECFLPYAGLDDIPHLKTPGEFRLSSKIEIKSEMRDYLLAIDPIESVLSSRSRPAITALIVSSTSSSRIRVMPKSTSSPRNATISTTRDTSFSRRKNNVYYIKIKI